MLAYFDEDFFKMAEGFVAIIIFAMISFFVLNYLSQDAEMQKIVASIFDSLLH